MKKIKLVLMAVLLFLAIFSFSLSIWVPKNFGDISMNQILYHLYVPLEGSNKEVIFDFILYCILIPLIISTLFAFSFHFILKRRFIKKELTLILFKRITIITICISTAFSFYYSYSKLHIDSYIDNLTNLSSIYEDYYVNPKEVDFQFPEKKRNLIYIFMESMETSFYSKELGGLKDTNLIPELYNMTQEHTSFVDSNNGGFSIAPGTSWTASALVGQTAGIPINVGLNSSEYGENGNYLSGAYSIGDILNDNGYFQELLIGSDAKFGARDRYFSQHGNYEIEDYISAQKNGLIPKDYWYWWGFEDQKLYEIAKRKLSDLSKKEEPFNLTMLTVDTHTPTGCDCPKCKHDYPDQYSNVIDCASSQIYEFVEWAKQQPFYENTTIIISGDHTTMNGEFLDVPDGYVRKGYNVFINPAVETTNNVGRELSSFDLFPTSLASLGVQFSENRLGLGTNLFSDQKTLVELLGLEKFNKQVELASAYYEEQVLHR